MDQYDQVQEAAKTIRSKWTGKPRVGTITVSASHQGGYVIIRIADDGRGLDTEAIRHKAVEKGLISEIDAEQAKSTLHILLKYQSDIAKATKELSAT